MLNSVPSPTQMLMARQLPQGQPPQIPDDLLNLLAAAKVKYETDAAAKQMAMQLGQKPPTIAEKVNGELQGNARQQIAQKLGLPGLMAQGQTPPPTGEGQPPMGANGAQPPAPPTQGMARGGLARLPSNLPAQYAGGGIIAFDGEDGSSVPNPNEPYSAKMMRLLRLLSPDSLYAGAQKTADVVGGTYSAAKDNAAGTLPSIIASAPVQAATRFITSAPSAPDTSDPNAGADAKGLPALVSDQPSAAPSQDSSEAPVGKFDTTNTSLPRLVAAIQTLRDPAERVRGMQALVQQFGQDAVSAAMAQPTAPAGAPAPAATTQPPAGAPAPGTPPPSGGLSDIFAHEKTNPVQEPVNQSIIRGVSQDPATVAQQAVAQRQDMVSGSQAAADQQRQEGIAALRAAQANQVAQRPSTMTRALQLMGQNLRSPGGLGAAFSGVSSGITASNEGYAAQDTANVQALQGLMQAQKDALAQNDISKWTALESTRKEIEANIEKAQTAGVASMQTTAMENARVESTLARFEQAKQFAQQNNDTKLQNILAGIDARISTTATNQAAAQAKTIPGMMDADVPALAAKIRAQLLASDPSYNAVMRKLGIDTAPVAPPPVADPNAVLLAAAQAEKLRRSQGK